MNTWKKIAEDKRVHPEAGQEHRVKYQVGRHTVRVTKNDYGLHVKVDGDPALLDATPEKVVAHVVKKVSEG
jgi:hypothetical protein